MVRVANKVIPDAVHLQVQKEIELLEEKYAKKKGLFSFSRLFPTSITHVYLVTETGNLMAFGSRKEEDADADIMAGMFTAVQNFIEDAFVEEGNKQGLERISKGNLTMLIERMPPVYLLTIISGKERPDIRMSMKRFLSRLFDEYGDIMKNWDGDLDELTEIKKRVGNFAHNTYM